MRWTYEAFSSFSMSEPNEAGGPGSFPEFSSVGAGKVEPLPTEDAGWDERLGRHDNATVARTIAILAS